MSNQRITQEDVARAAGVSRSTVTYALNGHPKISEETRSAIEKIARELGYAPDPMLSSLAYYRNRKRNATYRGLLAWLVYEHYDWRGSPHYRGYFNGAHRRALHHGYQLEEFHLEPSEASSSRTDAILRARGVNGILLSPLPSYNYQLDFYWEHFSVICFGYTLTNPRLNSVASSHYSNVRQALYQLRKRGCRRIGLVIDKTTDLRCNSAVSSGFIGEQISHETNLADLIPVHFDQYPLRDTAAATQALEAYLKKHRLDAFVTEDHTILERLKKTSLRVPADISVAGLNLSATGHKLSGIVEMSEHIGSHAVDMLTAMIQRGERGVPAIPVRSHVEGVWCEGKSTLETEPAKKSPSPKRTPKAIASQSKSKTAAGNSKHSPRNTKAVASGSNSK